MAVYTIINNQLLELINGLDILELTSVNFISSGNFKKKTWFWYKKLDFDAKNTIFTKTNKLDFFPSGARHHSK